MNIAVNTRALNQPLTGVQRYLNEVVKHCPVEVDLFEPKHFLSGVKGHIWEQTILPIIVGKRILWSPCNTGPINLRNQVVTIHDLSPIDHPEWVSYRFAKWYQYMTPRLARSVKRIITDSEFTKNRLLEVAQIEDDKVVVIPLGVDKKFFPLPDKRSVEILKLFNLPFSSFILSLSSLEPRKNIVRLIEAWRCCYLEVPDDICLLIAGETGKTSIFKELNIQNLPPRIFFTGRVDDNLLPSLYNAAMGFVYLSEYEGFGLPPLEAMACGTPVIVSNTTSLPEVVGDAALLVNPSDVDAISQELLRLTSSVTLREKLISLGISRAKRYTWEETSRLTFELLLNEQK